MLRKYFILCKLFILLIASTSNGQILHVVTNSIDDDVSITIGTEVDVVGNLDMNSNNISAVGDLVMNAGGRLVIPVGTTPPGTTVGTLFLDTDDGTHGTLKIYANGAWRDVQQLF